MKNRTSTSTSSWLTCFLYGLAAGFCVGKIIKCSAAIGYSLAECKGWGLECGEQNLQCKGLLKFPSSAAAGGTNFTAGCFQNRVSMYLSQRRQGSISGAFWFQSGVIRPALWLCYARMIKDDLRSDLKLQGCTETKQRQDRWRVLSPGKTGF